MVKIISKEEFLIRISVKIQILMSQSEFFSTGIINLPSSYHYQQYKTTNYKSKSVDPKKFYVWTNNYMYQTSYTNSHSKQTLKKSKSYAIPGYTGFIPSQKSQNAHGKTFTQLSKQCFGKQNCNAINPYGLSTTGMNVKPEHFIDKQKEAVSYKYGKGTLNRPHSSWKAQKIQSTSHQCFGNPRDFQNPTFKENKKWSNTMNDKVKASGYSRNNQPLMLYDKKSIDEAGRVKTEYRQNFNKQAVYHRQIMALREKKLDRLQKKKINFKIN